MWSSTSGSLASLRVQLQSTTARHPPKTYLINIKPSKLSAPVALETIRVAARVKVSKARATRESKIVRRAAKLAAGHSCACTRNLARRSLGPLASPIKSPRIENEVPANHRPKKREQRARVSRHRSDRLKSPEVSLRTRAWRSLWLKWKLTIRRKWSRPCCETAWSVAKTRKPFLTISMHRWKRNLTRR